MSFDKVPECVNKATSLEQAWLGNLNRLNVCSQKGLSERFDSTIGRGTVLMPFGRKNTIYAERRYGLPIAGAQWHDYCRFGHGLRLSS